MSNEETEKSLGEIIEAIAKRMEEEDALKVRNKYEKHITSRWVQISPAKIYECSRCGQNVMTDDIAAYKYCHGCGAKMEGN